MQTSRKTHIWATTYTFEFLLKPKLLVGINDMHKLSADGATVSTLHSAKNLSKGGILLTDKKRPGLELRIGIGL